MRKEVITDLIHQRVSVRMPMNSWYEKFMDAITLNSNSEEDRFISGVQCIIWGSLFIEALVNRESERLFHERFAHPDSVEAKKQHLMWELAQRADLEKKVEVLAQVFEHDEEVADIHRKQLKRLTRIRNRLVHYKEIATPVDPSFLGEPIHKIMGYDNEQPSGTFTFGEVQEKAHNSLANPNIVSAVLSLSLEERRREVHDIASWLVSLR